MSPSPSHEEYAQMGRQALAVAWVAAACIACLLWEHLVTFGQEVTQMWTAKWSIPKVLFLLNRYVVSVMLVFNCIASSQNHLSGSFCIFYLRWLVCTITVTNAVVEGILVARVWALYRTNKGVLSVVGFFYTGCIVTLIGLTIYDYVGETVTPVDDFASFPGCYAASVPAIIAGYWIAPVITESVLFFFIFSRAFAWWRKKETAPPTLVLLARDSTVYFAVIFLLLIANLFVFLYADPFLSSMMVTPSNTAGCIAGSRMLLNLRALSEPTPTEMEMEMSHGISFARNENFAKGKKRAAGPGETTTGYSMYTAGTMTVGEEESRADSRGVA